jgi:hypothetical protein
LTPKPLATTNLNHVNDQVSADDGIDSMDELSPKTTRVDHHARSKTTKSRRGEKTKGADALAVEESEPEVRSNSVIRDPKFGECANDAIEYHNLNKGK